MRNTLRFVAFGFGALAIGAVFLGHPSAVHADPNFWGFFPGNLVVSRSVYTGTASTVTVGQQLPPVCGTQATCTAKATYNGTYPNVWFNDGVDGSFSVTSPIYLDQLTPFGLPLNSLAIDTSKMVTSFSSKSELALNLSPDGSAITFLGYGAPPNSLDVSNSNTPGAYDSTNPAGASYYRVVGEVNALGQLTTTSTNSFSGDNGRAVIKANGLYYMVGNSNNGSGTPANVTSTSGLQVATPGATPGAAVQLGSFSLTQTNPFTGQPYGTSAEDKKPSKDNNFRGLTIFNNSLYATKGSGSNGIDSVYYAGAPGSLPPASQAPNVPLNILAGFNTVIARTTTNVFPFGVWFANENTAYVADEGDGTIADAATDTMAGLQKWSRVNGVWQLDYVLHNGLNLGQQYSIPKYPASLNPATDGLRNLTGHVDIAGLVTIWAVTSTVSNNGDQGADPNKLVAITDLLGNTNPNIAKLERFFTIKSAGYGEVLRGVCFTPGTFNMPGWFSNAR
jgi:hypothetical protein